MYFGNPSVLLLLILSCVSPGQFCLMRPTIHVLEEEYFSDCCTMARQGKGYTVNWYRKSEGNWTLIQGDNRIDVNGTYIQFWPAVLNDVGGYKCHVSNGTHIVYQKKWTLNVLKKNKTSCFNANHVSQGIPGILGKAYTVDCSGTLHKADVFEITWYKDCIRILQTDEKWYIAELTTADSGKYTCVKSFLHAGKKYNATHTIELKMPEGTKENIKPRLLGPDPNIIKTEIGKKEILNCTAFLGYSNTVVRGKFELYWVHNNSVIKNCQETDSPCQMEEHNYQEGGRSYSLSQLQFKSVKEENTNSSYTCNFAVAGYPSHQKFILLTEINPDLPLHVFTPGIITAISLTLLAVFVVILYAVFKVDLTLLYRDVTRKDETLGDGKIYDAFVSYLKDCIPLCGDERRFALDILPKMLEEHFGYKLCIFERDISPGGAVVDDVQSFIDQSRRLIIILSKNYISDKVMFELETGLHKALVDKKIKVILIEYMPISDFDFLPKSLELLSSSHVVKWKEEKSLPLNSRFWKKLRYAMPAKHSSVNAPAIFLRHISQDTT